MSYAYGAAVAAMGFLVVRAAPTPTSAAHAAALFAHGLRLNAFLLWREVHVERFRSNRESVEASARASGGRLQRAPFILCCSALYACMSAPIILSARAQAAGRLTASLVAIAWAGLVLGAIGDVTKSWVKARRGPDTLVVSGVYRLFRHPNYTGTQRRGLTLLTAVTKLDPRPIWTQTQASRFYGPRACLRALPPPRLAALPRSVRPLACCSARSSAGQRFALCLHARRPSWRESTRRATTPSRDGARPHGAASASVAG